MPTAKKKSVAKPKKQAVYVEVHDCRKGIQLKDILLWVAVQTLALFVAVLYAEELKQRIRSIIMYAGL